MLVARRLPVVLAAVAAVTLVSTAAQAQYRPKFTLEFFTGAHVFDDQIRLGVPAVGGNSDLARSTVAVGVRFGWEFFRRLSLELEALALPTTTKAAQVDVLLLAYRAQIMYRFLDGLVQPFVLAGYGGMTGWSTNETYMPNDTLGAFHFGVGARFPMGTGWGLRTDLRGLLPPSSAGGSKVVFDFEFLVSAYITFGEGPRDRDKDGIPDDQDRCPDQPGPRENQGCPDKDTDGDGVVDRLDRCPTTPAGPTPDRKRPGCPEGDADGDGLVDSKDKCPNVPAGPNPDPKKPGCPLADSDGDGILDPDDKCPKEPGPKENDGCPDKDADGDGLVDRLDKCPTQAGPKENDGCPLPEAIKKFTGKIEGITFALGSAKILPKSFKVLDGAVAVLKEFPKLPLTIEGHTSSEGKREKNMELSKARAESVKAYFASKGIEAGRLTAVGYGPDKPVADNQTKKGKEANRRIEFKIQ
ncbi:MAG: OmpA family protein [Deltaproteobacteria bacterium]|nr:OmpA family protein [Deltaproteobacteria bacterium]